MRSRWGCHCIVFMIAAAILWPPPALRAQELTEEAVKTAIKRGRDFLIRKQNADGSWTAQDSSDWQVGVSSIVLLSLINSGMTLDDEAVAKGLNYLRGLPEGELTKTYEVSLAIMALVAAKDGERDKGRILMLAQRLEQAQATAGQGTGSWSYETGKSLINISPDRSNGQFAILGLREAAEAGVPIDREVWERARQHWTLAQNPDGGWGYRFTENERMASTGSMTVAGIATMLITDAMLRDDAVVNPDGSLNCCGDEKSNEVLDRGLRWLEQHFTVRSNPSSGMRRPGKSTWLLYYLYGVERAGRLSGSRFFGESDWYREGAQYLLGGQHPIYGSWQGFGHFEDTPVVGTALALLFLSKGLSPVLVSKLKYGPVDANDPNLILDDNWNLHRDDVRNLTDLVASLKDWPKLVTWQVLDLHKAEAGGGVKDMQQAPVVFMGGRDPPALTDSQIKLLRDFIDQGGFLFATANCKSAEFDKGFRDLISKMYPDGTASLQRLPESHPIFHAEYRLENVELFGVDAGCRTAIVYSADDLSCLWDKWMRHVPPSRTPQETAMVTRATRIGVNVLAYATNREPPLRVHELPLQLTEGTQDAIERGFLQIAKLRHAGTWDAAPHALRNLLAALNRTVGTAASTKTRALPASDPNIFRYPMLFMHGRSEFELSQQEIDQLRLYLNRGGVIFADACCGSPQFDASFRKLASRLFSGKQLDRIPPDHELFQTRIGHEIKTVRRRGPDTNNPNIALTSVVQTGEPFLEGIELNGRYAVIYSKYDISCALENQASMACSGYVPEDAVKIAVNVVLYSLLQDVTFGEVTR